MYTNRLGFFFLVHLFKPSGLQKMVQKREKHQWTSTRLVDARGELSDSAELIGKQQQHNCLLPPKYVEQHLWTHSKLNFEADGLKQQKTGGVVAVS